MKTKKYCTYFAQNRCNRGDQCPFLHELPPGHSPNQKNSDNSICYFFMTDKCKNTSTTCNYFHGFGKRLLHVKKIEATNNNIINLVKMDDTKFISSDEKSFIVHFMQNDEKPVTTLNQEGFKIGKMIYSSNKVILAIKQEGQ